MLSCDASSLSLVTPHSHNPYADANVLTPADLSTSVGQSFCGGALANLRLPDIVTRLHLDYLTAGANVITTNTFAVTPWHLARVLGEVEGNAAVDELAAAAASCAAIAVVVAPSRPGHAAPRVAACLPPLRECYLGQDWLSCDPSGQAHDEASRTYRRLLAALAPHSQIALIETMSFAEEARVAARAARTSSLPVLLSFTLEDESASGMQPRLRSGQSLIDAAASIDSPVAAWLANCSSMGAVNAALPCLAALGDGKGAYGGSPNAFSTTTSEWLADSTASCACDASLYDQGVLTPHAFAEWGAHAFNSRTRAPIILGGCCGTSPAHITALAERLSSVKVSVG